ncbi:MAG: efflux RND transporter periplasmic adaptor subunit [Robiginitomaculum sp.]
MKLNKSYILAFLIAIAVVFWFIFGSIIKKNKPVPPKPAPTKVEKVLPLVEIKNLTAEKHQNYILLHGHSEAVREVSVKAETAGIVISTPVREGTRVSKNTLLCKQDVDARQATLDQAKAQLRSHELKYKAAETLVKKGFRSPTQAAGARAALDGARAQVKQAEIELDNINIRAPFSGVFERQIAEIGDYLSPGHPCGLLIDLDPLIITGEVTERQVGFLKTNQKALIKLATGQNIDGKIHLIETKANPETRTFRIEISVPNHAGKLKIGVTADIKIASQKTNAQLIPANVLTLNDTGQIGVRYLDSERIVSFVVVQTIDETQDGFWVTGLPDNVDLIIRGQDFVSEGTKVQTQYDIDTNAKDGTQ